MLAILMAIWSIKSYSTSYYCLKLSEQLLEILMAIGLEEHMILRIIVRSYSSYPFVGLSQLQPDHPEK